MLLLLVLSAGVFLSVVGEMIPASAIKYMAEDLNVSLGKIGFLITLCSFAVILTAPILTIITRGISRRSLMTTVIIFLGLFHASAALFTGYEMVAVVRFLTGAVHGMFWTLVGSIVGQLYAPHSLARAMSIVLGGGTVSYVIGLPLSNFFAFQFGWKSVVIVLGIMFVLLGLLFNFTLKVPLHSARMGPAKNRNVFKSKWMPICILSASVLLGQFIFSSYVPAFLSKRYSPEFVSILLFVYGFCGCIGNVLAGVFKPTRRRFMVIIATSLICILLFSFMDNAIGLAAYAIWGAMFGAVPVLLTVFLLSNTSDNNRDIANAYYTMSFNIGIGLGALFGGLFLDGFGFYVLPLASCAALLLSFLLSLRTVSGRHNPADTG